MSDFLQDLIHGVIGLTYLAGIVSLACFLLFWDGWEPRWAVIAQRVLRWALAVTFVLLVSVAFGHALRKGTWP